MSNQITVFSDYINPEELALYVASHINREVKRMPLFDKVIGNCIDADMIMNAIDNYEWEARFANLRDKANDE